jgi:hypothetical protein
MLLLPSAEPQGDRARILTVITCLQIMLAEMLARCGAAKERAEPDVKVCGCHLALLKALVDGKVFGPLQVGSTLTMVSKHKLGMPSSPDPLTQECGQHTMQMHSEHKPRLFLFRQTYTPAPTAEIL